MPNLPPLHTSSENLADWLSDPLNTYAAWTLSHPGEESTRKVKNFMWGKWCRYMAQHSLRLNTVDFRYLGDFFEKGEIAKAQRHRYTRLIERVYLHLSSLGLSLENPATRAAVNKMAKGANDPTAFLSEIEQAKVEKVIRSRFTEGLIGSVAQLEESKDKKKKRKKKRDWMRVRDAALCGAMMGGGATVFAAERMTVSCTDCTEGRISLPKKGGPDYEAVLLPLGHDVLDWWLERRRHVHADFANILFPADAGSRRRPETFSDTRSLSPSSIFRAVQNVLAEAGITGARACGQTLRNTYAATLIRADITDEDLRAYMGFADITSAIRLRAAWTAFQIGATD
ncbi:MAG: tyrosine-type recombinase/integrase [Propionivibrio sp.]